MILLVSKNYPNLSINAKIPIKKIKEKTIKNASKENPNDL
jgi:hypothetical protein